MAVSTNTLLVEGSFSELVEELAQYLDTISKAEPNAGIYADIETTLNNVRDAEVQEDSDQESLQKEKDEILKKVVTKAAVLNSAPERGKRSFDHYN